MKTTFFSAPFRRLPGVLAGIAAITGILLSLNIRTQLARTEAAQARLTAETLKSNTQQELLLFADVLESVGALHALSDAVDQEAMNEFIEKGMVHQRAVLGAFGLTQRIGPWLRSQVEQKEKNQPGAYQVVQRGPDGSWTAADSRPVYYPLTWQSRETGLNIPVGFDFTSIGQNARQAIARIEQTRRPTLVRTPAFFSTADDPAYWVFAPVIPKQVRSDRLYTFGNVIGFSVAVLHPETVLRQVAEAASIPAADLTLKLTPASKADSESSIRRLGDTWICRQPLNALNTQWVFECRLPLTAAGRHSQSAFVVGLLITALLVSQLLILSNRTRKIEAEVLSRTEDLHRANARLEKTLAERMHLENELHELTARERRKIGRDLHDSLGQKLTGAVFLSRSLMKDCGENSDTEEHARTLNETLKDTVAQVRGMARGLSPVSLNDESLRDTFTQLAEEMTGLYGIPCDVAECPEQSDLDSKTKEQLYLIAREAVNNAARHSGASEIILRFTADTSGWQLTVKDDGKGLPEQSDGGEGMGIRIMRHRANLVGAALNIYSSPDRGTVIEVTKK